jgi:hypothetical protein
MARLSKIVLLSSVVFLSGLAGAETARAEADKESSLILDKGIKALGGETRLTKIKGFSWNSRAKLTLGGIEHDLQLRSVSAGHGRLRQEFEGTVNGEKIKGVIIATEGKAWRRIGDMTTELMGDELSQQKRSAYLTATPVALLPLKGNDFKVTVAADDTIDGKPAAGIKVVPLSDGKEFLLYFDKQSGLPLKQVAKVMGFMGGEVTQETVFSDFAEFDGIKSPRKVEIRHEGQPFLIQEVTEFKILDQPEPGNFDEPK